ncbi:MAG TPA: hypothetical protein VFH26_07150 [Gemmatimonadales bacterium]|nr:hypothetical protein [Gemmatimonadales bacterium]
MARSFCTGVWLLAWLATPAIAQTAETADTADVLVVDHDFAALGELVRVFLRDKQVYRAELSSEDVHLTFRARTPSTRPPRIYPISNALSPSGGSVYEVYPDADGEYEIWPVSLQGSRLSTRVRLYRDVRESSRRMAMVNRPGWELGVELAGGWHSGFFQSSAAAPLGARPDAGFDLEACFTARNAPGASRLNLCVLGVSHQSQHNARNILWVYTEPRVRLFGRTRAGMSNWEMGPLFRFGVGIISGVSETPIVLGPGFYVARHIRTNSDGSGWSFQLSYFRGLYRGFDRPTGANSGSGPQSNRLSFGVGWYQ